MPPATRIPSPGGRSKPSDLLRPGVVTLVVGPDQAFTPGGAGALLGLHNRKPLLRLCPMVEIVGQDHTRSCTWSSAAATLGCCSALARRHDDRLLGYCAYRAHASSRSTTREGLRTVAVADACIQSAREERTVAIDQEF